MRGDHRTTLVAFLVAASLIAADASFADVPPLLLPLSGAKVAPRARAAPLRPEVIRQQFVGVNVAVLASGDAVAIDLFGERVIADHIRTEAHSPDRHTWVGRLRDRPNSLVVLATNHGRLTGQLDLDGRSFSIHPLASGEHVVEEIDARALPAEGPPVRTSPRPPNAGPPKRGQLRSPAEEAGDLTTIRILFVYTPAAEQGLNDLEGAIDVELAVTNQVFQNSSIPARVELAGIVRTEYVESDETMSIDLLRLRVTDDGFMDEIHAIRDELSADIVTLISRATDYCGMAHIPNSLSVDEADYGFNVVGWSCTRIALRVFTHELGHNMGGGHDRITGCGGIFPYSCGQRDEQFGTWRTIMAYGCSVGAGCPTIPYFSSPDVTYEGDPIGIPEGDPLAADNARTLRLSTATIAGFRGLSIGPNDVSATTDLFDGIRIEWAAPTAAVAGYRIHRSTYSWGDTPEAVWDAAASPFFDTTADVNTEYYYRVGGITVDGIEGGYSGAVLGFRRNANCGNGVVDAVGEECDGEVCCNLDCTVKQTEAVCRPATHVCDAVEYCRWQSLECPEDELESPGTPCTDDGNLCTDNVCEVSGNCVVVNNSAACDDGLFCNGPDYCMAGTCSLHAGTPCCYPTSACIELDDSCIAATSTTSIDESATSTVTTSPLPSPSLCGRPITGGRTAESRPPSASDCLFILRAAVGAATCAPSCVCDLNATARSGTTATDALICLRGAIDEVLEFGCDCPGERRD